jgi:CheY-like chemotaxis protein
VAETIPTRITADPVRLRQILLNFLSNAVKFTRDGEVHLEIAIEGGVAGASNLEFSVRDTGEGIPQDRISSLFKEFSMVDSTYARNAGGTGLGLAICKRLVTVMGGEIGVDSEPGKGSRFWFRIPLSVATEDTSNVPAEAPTLDELPQGPVRSLSILLVDDNGTNRMVASRMLEASGHRVLTAVDGREALAAAREQIFDVIFMDISMPVMDGLEATRRIRVLPDPFNCVPIVALTANALAGDRAQFLAAGMNDYLTKPVRRAALDGVLSKIARDSVDETVVGASDRVDHPEGSQRSHRVAEAVIDVTELSNLANETSSEIVQTVIATFNNELQGRVEELLAATGSHSLHEVERLAHAIAGSAASVGAIKLRGLAKRIEADGKANEFQSALARSQQIGAVAAETLEELRAFSAQLDHRAA